MPEMAEPSGSPTHQVALIEAVRRAVIGEDEAIATPFGLRRVTYADYTASVASLSFIEDLIREAVLPLYANTHTESSGTGLQTTRFREEARRIVRRSVGADADDHVVLFCGSGSTGAINTFIGCLGLRAPAGLHGRAREDGSRPVVFVGSLRAPFQRAAVARVDRRRGDGSRGRRRQDRSRGVGQSAGRARGPAPQDRKLSAPRPT